MMAIRLMSFTFIPLSGEGAIFACRCGGVAVYGVIRGNANCFRCGKEMALVKNVKPVLKGSVVPRLKGIKGGKA